MGCSLLTVAEGDDWPTLGCHGGGRPGEWMRERARSGARAALRGRRGKITLDGVEQRLRIEAKGQAANDLASITQRQGHDALQLRALVVYGGELGERLHDFLMRREPDRLSAADGLRERLVRIEREPLMSGHARGVHPAEGEQSPSGADALKTRGALREGLQMFSASR